MAVTSPTKMAYESAPMTRRIVVSPSSACVSGPIDGRCLTSVLSDQ